MDYIEIGCTPTSEECVQVDSKTNYIPAMRAEAERYVEMLNKRFPNCHEVELCIKSNSHDFGDYLDVRLKYYNKEGGKQALFMEHNLPAKWSNDEVLIYPPSMNDETDDETNQFVSDWEI